MPEFKLRAGIVSLGFIPYEVNLRKAIHILNPIGYGNICLVRYVISE